MSTAKSTKLEKQADKILKLAKKYDVEQNYFFSTTFNRYRIQLKILNELEKKIEEDGALVTKEYVKGRENVYTHPAIAEYNRTSTAANQTVATLIKVVQSMKIEAPDSSEGDELLKALGVK